jgi:hypothetical protein
MAGIFGSGSSGSGSGTSAYGLGNYNPFQRDQDNASLANSLLSTQRQLKTENDHNRSLLGNYQSQAAGSAPTLNTNFGSANLNTNFQAPQFGQGLDARGQGLLALEMGNRRAALERQQSQIQQQFKNNPALASILQSQQAAQGQLNNNPLAFQAAEARNSQMINESNATNNAQQLGNQAQLQQVGSQNDATQLSNTAKVGQQNSLLQGLQSAAGFGMQQNQLGNSAMAQLQSAIDIFSPKSQAQQQKGQSGGLLSGILK